MTKSDLSFSGLTAASISRLFLSVLLLACLSNTGSAQAAEACKDDLEIEFINDPEAIEYGKERFGARCVFCHGTDGLGAKGPALVKGKFKRGGCNQDIVINIASGIPGTQMGAFGASLEFDDILKIVAYLRDEERKLREAGEIE